MNKGTFNIHLVFFSYEVRSKGKDQWNRVHIWKRNKGFSVVDAFLLRESFHNQTRFVMLNSTFRGKYDSIKPLTFNNILFGRSRNYITSMILLQRIHIILHRLLSFRFPLCISIILKITSIKNPSHQRNISLLSVTMSLSTSRDVSKIRAINLNCIDNPLR